ncbi:MAG TPA: GNAT family N-acetyltransferase [Terriglobales bacterium]|jgi:hypothetical protein
MSERSEVYLKDRQSGQLVEATLLDGLDRAEVEGAEGQWIPFLQEQLQKLKTRGISREKWPEHSHWDWRQKFEATEGLLAYRMFGIECLSQMQGMMLVTTAGKTCRLASQRNKPLVYVHFLAAAPWNLPSIVTEPRFALVGSVMIAAAIHLSLAEEFSGRIGLHSLPQADDWYSRGCGMTDLGPDPALQNLRYFEMTPEQAAEFLK